MIDLKHSTAFIEIPKTEVAEYYDISHGQKRFWLMNQLDKSSAYTIPMVYQINSAINYQQLSIAFQMLVDRHEILRTYFPLVEGNVKQRVIPKEHHSFVLNYTELKEEDAPLYVENELNYTFSLESEALFKAHLIKLDENAYILTLLMHHIISDGWSVNILINELFTLYSELNQKIKSSLVPLKIQYKDFTAWQNNQLSENQYNRHSEYWLNKLSGELPVLDLPTDFVRPTAPSVDGRIENYRFPKTLTKKLSAFTRENTVSMFSTLLSAVYILLHKYSRQSDLILGTPVAGRSHPSLENQIGLYTNTLVLRSEVDKEQSFNSFVRTTYQTILEAFEHEIYPFDLLLEQLNVDYTGNRSPLFDVMVAFQTLDQVELNTTNGTDLKPYHAGEHKTSLFDLSFIFSESSAGIELNLEYSTALFTNKRISHMISHLETILSKSIDFSDVCIKNIELTNDNEKEQVDTYAHGTSFFLENDACLHELFEQSVENTPESIACVYEDEEWTYRELNRRANQFARLLQTHIKEDHIPVALFMEKSPEMIWSILGVLKAGHSYVPIDIKSPLERVSSILSECGTQYIISRRDNKSRLGNLFHILCLDDMGMELNIKKTSNLNLAIANCNPAYILFTSGSTGKPKGVVVEHKHISNKLFVEKEMYALDESLSTFQVTNYAFDVSLLEIFLPLMLSGKIVIPKENELLTPKCLLQLIEKESVTDVQGSPSFISMLVDHANKKSCTPLKRFCIGGESLNKPLVEKIQRTLPQVMINNHYGPTETTIDAIVQKDVRQFDRNIIGRPMGNTSVHILDAEKQLCPLGVPGEIFIGGASVAQGYLNRNELTNEKFIPNPFGKGRLYATGDLGVWAWNGEIEFLGRIDTQVKIRGYRIELGEIETTLRNQVEINDAVVKVFEESGEKYLVGYLVGAELDVKSLLEVLRKELPDYMIPKEYVFLPEFPLTQHGKVDKRKLLFPSKKTKKPYIEPRTEIEQTLVFIWERLLRQNPIGIQDNFFECGGHSLKAIELIKLIYDEFKLDIGIYELFKYPTIEHLSTLLEQKGSYVEDELIHLSDQKQNNIIFCIASILSDPFEFEALANCLTEYQLIALNISKLNENAPSLTELIEHCIEHMVPYFKTHCVRIIGYSAGARLGHAIVKELEKRNHNVHELVVLDSVPKHEEKVFSAEKFETSTVRISPELEESHLFKKVERYNIYDNQITNLNKIKAPICVLTNRQSKEKIEYYLEWEKLTYSAMMIENGYGTHFDLLKSENVVQNGKIITKMLKRKRVS